MTSISNVPDRKNQINGLACQIKPISPKAGYFNSLNTAVSAQSSLCDLPISISDLSLLRKPEVLAFLGISKSTLHVQINNGLIPPPISLGERAVAFVMHEIKAVLAAKIAGRSNDEIKQLVSRLVSSRQDLYEREVQACNI